MSKAKKIFIILAVGFIVIGLVMTGIALTAASFDITNLSTVSYETKVYDVKESFDVINVDDIDCDIRLLASESDICKVTVCDTAGMDHQVEVFDKALQITSSDTRKWYEHIGIFSWEETEVVIQLPEKEYRSILLKTISGDIEVSDEMSFEDAILISTSGKVLFNGKVKNELTARSTSGDIAIAAVNVENKAEIETVSGDIEFDAFDAGTIEMKTSSGDVEGEIMTPKNFITDTSSGDVTVPLSDSLAGDCVIKTVSGDIRIELEQ